MREGRSPCFRRHRVEHLLRGDARGVERFDTLGVICGQFAAVRATLVEEIVAKVEAMRTFGPVETFDGTKMDADNLASWLNKYELIDTIRGLAAPTTEEG
jgi:hypothetical protein